MSDGSRPTSSATTSNHADRATCLPGYAWTPDSKALVLSHHGHIWRVDADDRPADADPFTAEVDQMLGDLVRFEYPVNDTTLTVRQIRGARRRLTANASSSRRSIGCGSWTCRRAPKRLTTAMRASTRRVVARRQVHRVRQLDRGRRRHLAHPGAGGSPRS
jgi:hypothetical protein